MLYDILKYVTKTFSLAINSDDMVNKIYLLEKELFFLDSVCSVSNKSKDGLKLEFPYINWNKIFSFYKIESKNSIKVLNANYYFNLNKLLRTNSKIFTWKYYLVTRFLIGYYR